MEHKVCERYDDCYWERVCTCWTCRASMHKTTAVCLFFIWLKSLIAEKRLSCPIICYSQLLSFEIFKTETPFYKLNKWNDILMNRGWYSVFFTALYNHPSLSMSTLFLPSIKKSFFSPSSTQRVSFNPLNDSLDLLTSIFSILVTWVSNKKADHGTNYIPSRLHYFLSSWS